MVPPILGAIVFWGAILEDAYAVNKRVFFGIFVALITAVYVGIAVGAGMLLGVGDETNLLLSVAVTAVAVVAFQPVRARLQRVAMDPRVGGIAAALGGGCRIVKAVAILATAPGRPIALAGPALRSKGLKSPPHFF